MGDPFPFLESAFNFMTAVRDGRPAAELAVRFGGRAIIGDVDLTGVVYPHRLALHNCTFWGRFTAADARFGNTLDLSGCRFEKGLLLDGSRVDGSLVLESVVIEEYGPNRLKPDAIDALSLWQAEVRRSLLLTKSRIRGHARPSKAEIRGMVDLRGLQITGDVDFGSAEIGKDLFCRSLSKVEPRPVVGGRVWLGGATVGGSADFSGASIAGDLILQGSAAGGNLLCRCSSKDNPRTEVGGNVNLAGVRVEGFTTFARAEVGGRIFAVQAMFDDGLGLGAESPDSTDDRPTAVRGGIDLSYARVNARLSVAGLTTPATLNLHACRVEGDVDARPTPDRPTRVAAIAADGLWVGGNANFVGVTFEGPHDGPCLDLSFAEVQGDCALPGDRDGHELRLYHARLGEVQFGDGLGAAVVADGLTFRRLSVPADDFCRFLGHTRPFQKSTYETVERYLRERGEDERADLVFREMRRRDRRQELPESLARLDTWLFDRDHGHRKALAGRRVEERKRADAAVGLGIRVKRLGLWGWDLFLDVTTGCGTRSYRLGLYLLLATAAMWLMFFDPKSVRREVHPTAVELAVAPALTERDTHPPDAGKEWGWSEAGFTALRTVIPLMGDLPHAEWEPSGQEVRVFDVGVGLKYETVAGTAHALSYGVLPLFLASVTGWLKRRGE